MGFWIFLALVVVIGFWAVSVYNNLVAWRNNCSNAYSQIDVQLKRRYDLIPQLVEIAKTYMAHERNTLEAVIAARNQAFALAKAVDNAKDDPEAMSKLISADSALTSSMGKLFALSESYPDLKANQNMMQLTEELTSTENRIGYARQAYNDTVTEYNTACESFPGSIFAGTFNFRRQMLWQIENLDHREPVQVKF